MSYTNVTKQLGVTHETRYRIVKKLTQPKGDVISDVLIELETSKSRQAYPQRLRLVTAEVEVNGVKKNDVIYHKQYRLGAEQYL